MNQKKSKKLLKKDAIVVCEYTDQDITEEYFDVMKYVNNFKYKLNYDKNQISVCRLSELQSIISYLDSKENIIKTHEIDRIFNEGETNDN